MDTTLAEAAVKTAIDFEIFKIIASNLSVASIAVGAAYLMYKNNLRLIEKNNAIYEARIAALEKAVEECSEDRKELHEESKRDRKEFTDHLLRIESEVLSKHTAVMDRTNVVLEKMELKLKQEH